MEITEVRMFPAEKMDEQSRQVKAYASVIFDYVFVVNGLRVLKGKETDYFVAMPNRKVSDGTYRDIAHPIKEEFRLKIEKTVLHVYDAFCKKKEKNEALRYKINKNIQNLIKEEILKISQKHVEKSKSNRAQ